MPESDPMQPRRREDTKEATKETQGFISSSCLPSCLRAFVVATNGSFAGWVAEFSSGASADETHRRTRAEEHGGRTRLGHDADGAQRRRGSRARVDQV